MLAENYDTNLATSDSAIKFTILKLAAFGNLSLDDCTAHITSQILELDSKNGIAPSLSPRRLGLEERIANCCEQLFAANLVAALNSSEFSITDLGRKTLIANPHGISKKTLAALPGFDRSLREVSGGLSSSAICATHYDEGFCAYRAGQNYTDNPYQSDRAEHLAWHNGWSEAADHEDEHGPLYNTKN